MRKQYKIYDDIPDEVHASWTTFNTVQRCCWHGINKSQDVSNISTWEKEKISLTSALAGGSANGEIADVKRKLQANSTTAIYS